MKNLKDDIKIWMENKEVEKLFKEMGFELLKDDSLVSQMKEEHLSTMEVECHFYVELFNQVLDNSQFFVKEINGIFGYKEKNIIFYLNNNYFAIKKNMTLSEYILMFYSRKEEIKYEDFREQLNLYGLNIRDYTKVINIYEDYDDSRDLNNKLEEIEDICKYGRVLKDKKWKITKKEFLEWRKPRFGENNPTKIISKVWEYGVHTRNRAYWINEKFEGPSSFDEGAAWYFERFGKSVTFMPDGREIHISGEHEDHYDPDFYIYNDVIVVYPDDSIEFYNYPEDVFPPTDFHTATLVDDTIVMIGNLGYGRNRQIGKTQILLLDTKSYKIEKIEPIGVQPGWIHNHKALLSEDKKRIKITGGKIDLGSNVSLVENIDEWELDLVTWQWKNLTVRIWSQYEFRRKDETLNNLFWIRQALFSLEANWDDKYKSDLEELTTKLGFTPNVASVKKLYLPDVEHKIVTMNNKKDTYIITLDGVNVRFNERMDSIAMTIEGTLKDEYVENIKASLLEKLEALEGSEYIYTEVFRDKQIE